MTENDSLDFLHDAELLGIRRDGRTLHLIISTDEGLHREIRLNSVDRLVAMPFLFGNVISAARTVRVTPGIAEKLTGISDDLRTAFFDIYGLPASARANYDGNLFILESSLGCEILCTFKGPIDVI